MAIEEVLPQYAFVGIDEENDPGLFASTAKEGPQVLLQWRNVPLLSGGVCIVRSVTDYPETTTDGEIVYETEVMPPAQAFADLTVRHETFYYYTLFAKLDGMLVLPRRTDGRPLQGAFSWAFGGATPHLEPLSPVRAVGAIAEGYAFERGSSTLRLSSSSLANGGATRGRWVRVGTRSAYVDLMLLEVVGLDLRFERYDDAPPAVMGPGTVVELMAHTKSQVVHLAYQRLMRRRIREMDRQANQGVALLPAASDDGQVFAPGQPGTQLGMERFTRPMYAEHALQYSGAGMLSAYVDNDRCPVESLPARCAMYGRKPLDGDRGHRVREFARVQPHLANWNGAEDKTRKRVEIATGQPVAVRYGADRVVRFGGRTAFGSAGLGFIGSAKSITAGDGENSITDLLSRYVVDSLPGAQLILYDPHDDSPHLFTVLSQAGQKLFLDGDPLAPGHIYYMNMGVSDDVLPVNDGRTLYFEATGTKIRMSPGKSWADFNVTAKCALIVAGATNAGNNNGGVPVVVTTLSTTNTADDTIEVSGATFVDETTTNASVRGGIVGRYLMDKAPTGAIGFTGVFPTVGGGPGYSLAGQWIIPNTADTGGPNGNPRVYEIEANDTHWIRVKAGSLGAGATPGASYRIFSRYQLVLPPGTRRDRRHSFWRGRAGFFNDCGLAFFVKDALTAEQQARAAAELADSRGLTESLYLLSDGSGRAKLEVDLT